LTKTKKSLEHLKSSVEKYRKVFTTLFNTLDSQKQIVELVVNVFAPATNEEMRDKTSKVI
jgi:hypothetical protein